MTAAHPAAAADALALGGRSGDLARRKLLPALYDLAARGLLDLPLLSMAACDWSARRCGNRCSMRSSRPGTWDWNRPAIAPPRAGTPHTSTTDARRPAAPERTPHD